MARKTTPVVPSGAPGRLPNRSVDQPIVDRRSIGLGQLKQEVRDQLGTALPAPLVGEVLSFLSYNDPLTAGLTNDYVNCIGLIVPKQATFDAIVMHVSTGGATNVKLGLYASDGEIPTELLAEAGTISAATSGVKVGTFASPQVLTPGLYFVAFLPDTNTAQFTYIPPIGHLRTSSLSVPAYSFQISQAYASGFPDPSGATTAARGGGGWPIIGLRRSA